MADFGNADPKLDEQLYGPPIPGLSSLADTPWSWVPEGWNDGDGADAEGAGDDDQLKRRLAGVQRVGPGGVAASPVAELPASGPPPALPGPPPVSPSPADSAGAGAPLPAPIGGPPGPPPELGFPAPAFDAAANSPPGMAPPPVPGGMPAIPLPTGPFPSDVPALGALPPILGATPRRIAPETLDQAPTAAVGAVPQQQWAADPLHAPDLYAETWAKTATPEEVLDQARKLHTAQQTKFVADMIQAGEDRVRDAREAVERRQKADAATVEKDRAITADALKLAQTKIDPDRWMSTRSAGQKLAALIAVVAGGLYQGRTGSARNIGMDLIQQHIDHDIDAQKQDIESGKYALGIRQNQVAQEFKRTGDLYAATEVVRLATYQAALARIQTEQQNFDPHGAGYLNRAIAAQEMQGRIAQAGEARRKTIFEETDKVIKADQEQQKINDTRWKAKQDVALAWTKETREANAKKEDQVFTPAELAAIHPGAPVPPIGMTLKNFGSFLETSKKGQEAALGGREYTIGDVRPVRDADGNIVGTQAMPFVNGDKKPFLAPSTDEAKKLRNQKAGVDTTNQFVNQMTAGIRKYGGSSEFFRSPEWQTMKANNESLLFALHQAYGVEGFRPGVLEQMEKALGGQDPNKITVLQTNAIPGLEAAKKAVNAHFNSNLRAAGYTGEEYSPADVKPPDELPQLADRTLAESAPGLLDKMGAGLKEDARALVSDPTAAGPGVGAGPESGPPVGPTGLSVDDTAKVQDLVRRYKNGTPATKERVVTALTAPLGAGRPSLNAGILGLVAGEAPELYQQLLQALPADQREAEIRNQAALSAIQGQLPGGKK